MVPQIFNRLGVDVGGTFTDVLLLTASGDSFRTKVLTTVHDPSVGVKSGIQELDRLMKAQGRKLNYDLLNHGTTVATNAILEGKGARVALLVTEGYKDILQIRRSQVPGRLAGWMVWPKPEPLAPLEMTIEVAGRINTHGQVLREFDERALRESLQLLRAHAPEAITISLINSFANSSHEELARRVVKQEFPDLPVSVSFEVLPELMEYERTITTVADAYVKPRVQNYLLNLQDQFDGSVALRILRSDGGLSTVKLAADNPVNLLMSGPSGGVAGVVSVVAKQTQFHDIICCDMGGTSTDVCIIKDSTPKIRRETRVGDLFVRSPSVDVRTVGAGGGSVAHVPEVTGALRVGPRSAGAIPGPACYSRGGREPTVTDANAVLGYLPPSLLGGSFLLDIDAARQAVQSVADALNLDLMDAAEGIVRMANENMLGALRVVSVEAGHDPREFALVSFGGAGPLHGCALGKLLHSKVVIVPPSPGVLCAFGDATTSLRHEVSSTFIRKLSMVNLNEVIEVLRELREKVTVIMESQGVPVALQSFMCEADVRYSGQSLYLPVSFDLEELSASGLHLLAGKFSEEHRRLFTFALDLPVEIVNIRVKGEEGDVQFKLPQLEFGTGVPSPAAIKGTTSMYQGGKTYSAATIWERSMLRAGDKLEGPCIITEMDSNTLVHVDYFAEVDRLGNLLLWPKSDLGPPKTMLKTPTEPSASALDPIVIDIVESALASAREEMDVLMTKCAMSPGIREQRDEFPMIANPAGLMMAGQFGSFLPDFLASWTGTVDEGDIFLTNDAYALSGAMSHLNDVLVVVPVFCDGELIAWTANFGHMSDVGGAVPGSLGVHNRDIFSDGLQIPPVKIYEKGICNESILQMCYRNTRLPHYFRTDLHALMAACNTAAVRMIDLCRRFGKDVYHRSFNALLERNKRVVRNLIKSEIPLEGVSFEDYIDDDGERYGPWKIACRMYKADDERGITKLHFDFSGTDPQADTSINFLISKTMWKMFAIIYLTTVFDPSIVVNDGAQELIEVHIPLGTFLNPIRPAPLSCRTHALGRALDVLGALFGIRNPTFLSAAGFSDSPHFYYSGYNDDGSYFLLYHIMTGGIPARPIGDGPDGHSLWPSMQSVPCEYLELYFPLVIEKYELVENSGGPGTFRGGNGIRVHYRFLAHGQVSLHDDRWLTKPWGVNGGEPGKRSRRVLLKKTGGEIVCGAKAHGIMVETGDVLCWETWGGGGKGNPLKRDPNIVALEVERRFVTPEYAHNAYGVVLTRTSAGRFCVDQDATTKLREDMIPARKEVEKQMFNPGGTIAELLAACEAETGLPPPILPSTRILRGPAAKALARLD